MSRTKVQAATMHSSRSCFDNAMPLFLTQCTKLEGAASIYRQLADATQLYTKLLLLAPIGVDSIDFWKHTY